ncbi:MAG: DNA repair protein RecO [Gammaproteobacteria bacterium]|nr:MAG: DNA repair protein RecO [Gammaproteobacteria bacterium]
MRETSAGFVLHRQDYRETSRILRCYTREHGRVDLLCKGCRSGRKNSLVVEPFRIYEMSWSGRSELKTLSQAEEMAVFPVSRSSECLYCGFYINELLSNLTRSGEADDQIFDLYKDTLSQLSANSDEDIQPILRRFELSLLQCLGYGIALDIEQDGITPVQPDARYGFHFDQGLYRINGNEKYLVHGDTLLALQQGRYTNDRQVSEARTFMRHIIRYYLSGVTIHSRKLFA